MKIEIPKVIAAVDLGEYAPELRGKVLNIWVNATNDMMAEYVRLSAEANESENGTSNAVLNWYAEIWSQGKAETHWTLEELRELEQNNGAFLAWMISATWNKISESRTYKKKG